MRDSWEAGGCFFFFGHFFGGGGEVFTLIEGDWIWGAGVGYGKVLGRLACCGGDLINSGRCKYRCVH